MAKSENQKVDVLIKNAKVFNDTEIPVVQDVSIRDGRVFERGTGETLACGTGACAATVVGCLNGLLDETVEVGLKGGCLKIQWPFSVSEDSPVVMTGPAHIVYDGIIEDS